MAYKKFWLVMLVLALAFGMTVVGCDSGGEDDVPKNNVPNDDVPGDDVPEQDVPRGYAPPEDRSVKDRWGKWTATDSTATLDYSVDDDGVCTITVGGTAQPFNETDNWGRWKAVARYYFTVKAGASYKYTFEAWTESGTRDLHCQYLYFVNDDEEFYKGQTISITSTRKTYTIYGADLPKGAVNYVEFQCADQLGKFYVKILEIKEYEKYEFNFTSGTSAAKTVTGENDSKMFKFTGDDFTKIKNANPGSFLEVTYRANVSWACGEIGWKSITDAGPVIIGNGTNKNQTAYYDIADLVLGNDNFTIHIFNQTILREVTLYAASDGYVPAPNPKATAGAIKIVIPQGHEVFGNGDLSKVDFKKITTAASGTLVFYFDDDANTDSGILKFGPKSSVPYKHYGIAVDGTIADYVNGWRFVNAATKTITYNVSDIKKSVADAAADFPGGIFEWLEINMGSDNNADLLYIELIP